MRCYVEKRQTVKMYQVLAYECNYYAHFLTVVLIVLFPSHQSRHQMANQDLDNFAYPDVCFFLSNLMSTSMLNNH